MATDKVATQIRIEEDLYEMLKTIAEKEQRSLNNLMVCLLWRGVNEYLRRHRL
jgi:hypothetical protein